MEAAKIFGAVLWVFGVVALLINLTVGLLLLGAALAVTVWVVTERRHQERLSQGRLDVDRP